MERRPMGRRLADPRAFDSLSNRMRAKRFRLFLALLDQVTPPIRLLDVGGTPTFWSMRDPRWMERLDVTCLNLEELPSEAPRVRSIVGDARDLSRFGDRAFDVAFSNSVIEHVGGADSRRRMAQEIRRVARRYFVQTPNRYFPIEPHFVFPFFQFLPRRVRIWLLLHFDIGWSRRKTERVAAERVVDAIELIGEGELRRLFPEARIYREKFYGFTKSLIAYHGW
jgi:hypothetical protein